MAIPEDIQRMSFTAAGAFYHDIWIRDELAAAFSELISAERERCAQAARDYLANEYMPDFGSLPDDLAAAIRSVPASLEE